MRVRAAPREQLGMRPLLGHAVLGQHDDLVRVADGGQAVRDGQHLSLIHIL